MDEKVNQLIQLLTQKNVKDMESDLNNVCQMVKNNELSIEKLVIDLRPLLTNTETNERSKGLYILSQVINGFALNFLSEKEVQHLVVFYCDRLKDHYSVIPNVFSGLLAISKCSNHSPDLSQMIFNGLVKEIAVQQYPVSERFMVYQLLTQLFQKHAEAFKAIKAEFIYGLIQIIEGERDPRCLLLVFRLTSNVIKTIDIEPYTEDLFEVISCYFPVIFTPPPNDEYGITREDLSNALEVCLISTPAFTEFLFPLLLEKLESELKIAKLDSYKVLELSSHNYSFDKIKAFLPQIWTCIRIDCLKCNQFDAEVSDSALRALTAVSDALSSEDCNFDYLYDLIWKDIEPAFHKPELQLMESAISIVNAIISKNVIAFNKLIAQLMPLLLQRFTFTQKELYRIEMIDSIARLLSQSRKISSKQKDLTNCDSLFMLLTSLSVAQTENDDFRVSVISCLQQLILSLNEIKDENWKVIYKVLHSLLNYTNSEKLLSSTYLLLESVVLLNPTLVNDKLIKPLIVDFDSNSSTESNQNRLTCTLKTLEVGSSDMNAFQLVIPLLVEEIKSNSYFIDENQETYSLGLTKCLLNCINKQKNIRVNEKMNSFLYNECLDPLIQHCIHVSICTDNKSSTTINIKLMNSLYVLIGKGVVLLHSQYSQQLFDKLLEFSIFGKVDKLLRVMPPTCFCTFVNGPNFFDNLNETQALIVFSLIHVLLCHLNYKTDDRQIIELLDKFEYHSIHDIYKNTTICRLCSQTISSIVNRFDDKNESLNNKLNQLLALIEKIMQNSNEMEDKLLGLDLCIWITKALVISGHKLRKQFIEFLIKLLELEDQVIKSKVSKAFSIVHNSDEGFLSPENHSNVKLLYHQSFYFETFEPLLNGYLKYKSIDSERKQFYLTSLLTQLNYIPKAVFRNELNRLLPMLLDAINANNCKDNQMAALDSISQILVDKNIDILDASLKSTVNNCINLSINSPYLTIRRSALNCLTEIANTFDDSILSHLRDEVVRNLRKSLNDKKRIVRQMAVRARCKWILVGQPGDLCLGQMID